MDTIKNFDAKVAKGQITFEAKKDDNFDVIVATEMKHVYDDDTETVIAKPVETQISVTQINSLLDSAVQQREELDKQVADADKRIAFLKDQLLPELVKIEPVKVDVAEAVEAVPAEIIKEK